MNRVILMGRLTRDPDIRYSAGDNSNAVARYTLAVDRRFARRGEEEGQQTADFIGCVAFGRSAEFAQKYLQKGTKILVTGRIQTGSYTNRDGQKVYTTDVVVEDQEFAESKNAAAGYQPGAPAPSSSYGSSAPSQSYGSSAPAPESASAGDGFMNIPVGAEDDLPFN